MDKKRLTVIGIAIIALAAGSYFISVEKDRQAIPTLGNPVSEIVSELRNSTFEVEGNPVTLANGVSEKEILLGATSKLTTRYFGNEAFGDLNGDGVKDVAFLITQDGGGSGLFYYAVAAIKAPSGYKMTNAFFIGDRIAPQTTEIHELEFHGIKQAEIRVNYAERRRDEPMSARPSVGATKLLKVTPDGVLEGLMK